jgi:hypothetical protein
VSASALQELATSPALKEVFAWNTGVTGVDLAKLEKEIPHIRWDIGYVADAGEVLKLNMPMLRNKGHVLNPEEKVVLKHNLPGTVMRYTLDGSVPDSINSPLYKDPLAIGNFATIKTKAFKDGWLSSDVAEFVFFRKGYQPDTVALLAPADERFQGEGALTLIDQNKGLPDFYRHPAWIAFRENDMIATFAFEKEIPTVRSVTLSFAHNRFQICMPPDEMQVWGGNQPDRLQLISKLEVNPVHANAPQRPRIEGVSIALPESKFKYYKLVARPVKKLPGPPPAKKRNIWLMVDEVFFN